MRTVLVYVPVLGGYDIACRKRGDVYGFSDSPDAKLLAGFNRNRRKRPAKARTARAVLTR
jgi:hypothetical protein